MKFLGFACLAILLGATEAAQNPQMQINYYTDDECSENEWPVVVTWASEQSLAIDEPNCFNYNYGNSVKVANCYEESCRCYFFSNLNCDSTDAMAVANETGNCSPNSNRFHSFGCYYSVPGSGGSYLGGACRGKC